MRLRFYCGTAARERPRWTARVADPKNSVFPWRHRAGTCACRGQAQRAEPASAHQIPARFPPRTTTDSPICNRCTPLHFIFAGSISVPLRSDGRKSARQSQNFVRARTGKNPGRVTSSGQGISNTARGCACRRGQSNMPAWLRPGKTPAISAGTIQFSRRSAGCACETGRPRW